MLLNSKISSLYLIVAGAVLVAFLAVVFFSLPAMLSHGSHETTPGTCLFPTAGTNLCANGDQVALLHHIVSYQSFFNILSNVSGWAAWFGFLMLTLCLGLGWSKTIWQPRPRFLNYNRLDQSWQSQPGNIRLKRWLSFLTNSPSLIWNA